MGEVGWVQGYGGYGGAGVLRGVRRAACERPIACV